MIAASKYNIEVIHNSIGQVALIEVWSPKARIAIRATHGYLFQWHYEYGEYPWNEDEDGPIIQRDDTTLEMNPHDHTGVFIIKPILESMGYTVNLIDWFCE
jgi:nuclear transport factor 2 (NTF2) superfamily protein